MGGINSVYFHQCLILSSPSLFSLKTSKFCLFMMALYCFWAPIQLGWHFSEMFLVAGNYFVKEVGLSPGKPCGKAEALDFRPLCIAHWLHVLPVLIQKHQRAWSSLLPAFRKYYLLWWCSGKESSCQYRRCRFNPWVGKILWRRKWQPTFSIVTCKIPWIEEPDGLQSMGSQSQTLLNNWTHRYLLPQSIKPCFARIVLGGS